MIFSTFAMNQTKNHSANGTCNKKFELYSSYSLCNTQKFKPVGHWLSEEHYWVDLWWHLLAYFEWTCPQQCHPHWIPSGQITIIPKPELRGILGGFPYNHHHLGWPTGGKGRYNLPRFHVNRVWWLGPRSLSTSRHPCWVEAQGQKHWARFIDFLGPYKWPKTNTWVFTEVMKSMKFLGN